MPLEREAEVPAESKCPWRRESSTEQAPRDQGPQEEKQDWCFLMRFLERNRSKTTSEGSPVGLSQTGSFRT